MSLHDAYARRTPYERFLPDPGYPDRHFGAIASEAVDKGITLDDPAAFAMLEAASVALDEVRDPGDDSETLHRHALMLFHAYHHHAAGTPLYLLATGVVRRLVEPTGWGDVAGGGVPPPTASLYLQFPQHLVWARAEGDPLPTSLDGAFWTAPGDGRIHLLAVGGLLGEAPGFTVLAVPAAPAADEGRWRVDAMRQGGVDFASEMPGAELEQLYEIRTVGEALKLGARAVEYLRRHPEAVAVHQPPAAGTPTPTVLPSLRVEDVGGNG